VYIPLAVLLLYLTFLLPVNAISQGDEVTQKYLNSVVHITTEPIHEKGNGFGFVVGKSRFGDKLYVITAKHVVVPAGPFNDDEMTIIIKFREEQWQERATLLNYNSSLDIALLRVSKPKWYQWEKGVYCPNYQRNEKVWFIGRSGNWFVPVDNEAGIIRETNPKGLIEISIPSVLPGTSGAPLISQNGIIGIIIDNSISKTQVLPIKKVKTFVEQQNYPWGLQECTQNHPSPPPTNGSSVVESLSRLNIYVWDFTTRDFQKNELTEQMTKLFESQLLKAGCFAKVLQRRDVYKVLFHREQETEITNEIWGISENTKNQLKKLSAHGVVFGSVNLSQSEFKNFQQSVWKGASLEARVEVTAQALDTAILGKSSVDFKLDEKTFKSISSKMQELAENLCPKPPIQVELRTLSRMLPPDKVLVDGKPAKIIGDSGIKIIIEVKPKPTNHRIQLIKDDIICSREITIRPTTKRIYLCVQ